MTKKEQAEMDALRKELALVRALRFTEFVEPDVSIPQYQGIINGWTFNAYLGSLGQSLRVEKACTSFTSHAFGQWDRTNAQGPLKLYSNPILAAYAGRATLARECAQKLAQADALIEQMEREQQ